MMPENVRKTLQKAVDNAIEEVMCSYQRTWSTPPEKIERAMREDPELNALFEAQEYLAALSQAPEPDWSQSPSRAEWWSVYPSGLANWSVAEPKLAKRGGWHIEGVSWTAGEIDIPIEVDWRILKQRRPQPTQENSAQ